MSLATAPSLHSIRSGEGEPLVFLHGFTQNINCWGPFAALVGPGHEQIFIDLPGHGGSQKIDADLPTAASAAAHTAGKGTWIGYSLGGRVALHIALQHPELVERLVLIGATGGIDNAGQREQRRGADNEIADHLVDNGVDAFLEEWLAQPLFAGLTNQTAALEARRHNTATGLASSLRNCGTGTQVPLWDRLSKIDAPTLIIAGELDEKFTAIGHRLVTTIGANATLTVIEGTGHSAHLERPDETAEAITKWIALNPR